MNNIIVKCLGGLGNQMFQYAFYRCLRLDGRSVVLDISEFDSYELHNGFELERIFGIRINLANANEVNKIKQMVSDANILQKIWWKIANSKPIIHQESFAYSSRYKSFERSRYLEGYWQSEKYFDKYADVIRHEFNFPELDYKNTLLAEQICDSNSVSIHVRRGDYVNHPIHGGICTLDYYQQAIDIITTKLINPKFFVFSNINWCKVNLNLENAVYITGNYGKDSYKDMQLMSMCKHNIIANSSFSWWGAWLNNNQDKIVIAPQKWFNDPKINTKDLIPDRWHKI